MTRSRLNNLKPGASSVELRESILELCRTNGYDPIAELIDMADGRNSHIAARLLEIAEELDSTGPDDEIDTGRLAGRLRSIADEIPALTPSDEIAIHKEVAAYIGPKTKSIDIQQTVKATVTITVKNFVINATQGAIEATTLKNVTPVPGLIPHVAGVRHG